VEAGDSIIINQHNEDILAALMMWREARDLPPSIRSKAYRAILHAAKNRIGKRNWGETLSSVILKQGQFDSFDGRESDREPAIDTCEWNSLKWPNEFVRSEWNAWVEAYRVAEMPGRDPTGGANHFHSRPEGREPNWTEGSVPVMKIGPFKFYRL
jgi:hypothetical protein